MASVKGVGEIEKAILSVSSVEELSVILKSGIDNSYFVKYGDVFDYVTRYYQRYGKVPSSSNLRKSCGFEAISLNGEELDYYIDQLHECKVERELAGILDESIELIEGDAIKALDFLATKVVELKGITEDRSHLSYTDRDAIKRADDFADRMIKANQEKTLGIPTGITVFDKVTGGWMPGQLASIIGRLNEGKSWLLMFFCIEAYKSGSSILFLSPEMTVQETELRFDTLLSQSFRNTDLTLGRQTIDVQEYKAFLEELQERSDWITYDSIPGGKPFTLSSIQALTNLHKPDVLAIDGIPLIADELGAEQSWQKMINVGYGLKGIAINYGVVVLSTSQATRESADKGIPKLHQISYGDALAQACDKVIGIHKVSPTKVKMSMPKNRGGKVIGEFYIHFDVDVGKISMLEESEDIADEDVFGGGFSYDQV